MLVKRIFQIAAVLVGLFAGSAESQAQVQKARARARAKALVLEGLAAQERGDLTEAAERYRSAYTLVPHPELLFNLGQVYRQRGKRAAALAYYRLYLSYAGSGRAADEAAEWIGKLVREQRLLNESEQRSRMVRGWKREREEDEAREADEARASWGARRRKVAMGFFGASALSLGSAIVLAAGSSWTESLGDASGQQKSAAGLALGGVSLAVVGVVLWESAPEDRDPRAVSAWRAGAQLSPSSAGLSFSGSF